MKGFTLIEMLVVLALGIFIVSLLIKIYAWQLNLHHKIEDMIFLDRNGVLAINIIKNEKDINKFDVKDHELRYKKNPKDHFEPLVSGVESLEKHSGHIILKLKAPHGMLAEYSN